jgi:hypothetical protein
MLLHLLSCADGDVDTVRSLRNVIVCKITARPHGESCDPLPLEREPEPRLDESARFTPLNNFFIPHNTCNNNTQQEVPSTLGVSVSVSRKGGRKQRVV